MNQATDSVEELLAIIANAKVEENLCAAKRRAAEDKLVALATGGHLPETGSQHLEGNLHEATIKFSTDYKFDDDALDAIYDDIPDDDREALVRIKREVKVAGFKDIRENNKALFAVISKAVSSKPARPSISVSIKD